MRDTPSSNPVAEIRLDRIRGDIALHASAVILQTQAAFDYLTSLRVTDEFWVRPLLNARENMAAALRLTKELERQRRDDTLSGEAAVEYRAQRKR